MKTITRVFAFATLLLMFAVNVQAQITATATATATIIAPINLTKEVDLDFGNLAVSATGGIVTLEASNPAVRTQSGGVTFPIVAGTVTAAEFTVTGVPETTYEITIPSADLIITNTTGAGGETMIVNNFTSSPSGAGLLDLSGEETLYVGADVIVDAFQQYGVYISDVPFDVTVNYN